LHLVRISRRRIANSQVRKSAPLSGGGLLTELQSMRIASNPLALSREQSYRRRAN
jgi:hypothetical protein